MSKYTFDMPHALVTLTDVEGNVEIEVWPKAGQSAYVVVPPPIARLIAEQLVRMAAAAEADEDAEAEAAPPDLDGADGRGGLADPRPASNVVDLASRRRPN